MIVSPSWYLMVQTRCVMKTTGGTWSLVDNKLVNQHYQITSNHNEEKKLFDTEGSADNLIGHFKHSITKTKSQTFHNLPILLHFRPFHQSFDFTPGRMANL